MTTFIQGTKSVDISGGNFRQTSYNEHHKHDTRVSREDKTFIHGNIYGYTHTATSDDGPIIAYSHTTNITRPQYDQNSGRSSLSLPRGPTHQLSFNDTALLGDGTERRSHNRDMTVEKEPVFLLPETRYHTSEPLAYPDLDDPKMKAEFLTMSPEMQRYVTQMLGRLEKRRAASDDTTKTLTFGTRGPTADLAYQKPLAIHSEPGSRGPYHIGNSLLNRPITPSPPTVPYSFDHGVPETQSLSNAGPSIATNDTQDNGPSVVNTSREVPPDVAPKHSPPVKGPLMKSLETLSRHARRLFANPGKW